MSTETTTGFRLSDELWAVLEPLQPVRRNTHRFGGGRPRVPGRRCADAIFKEDQCHKDCEGLRGQPHRRVLLDPKHVVERLQTKACKGR